MLKSLFRFAVVLLAVVGAVSTIKSIWGSGSWSSSSGKGSLVPGHSILYLELKGVILNGEKFLSNLKEYRDDDKVKAIFVKVNSPGGAVGPSQEIYSELKKTRQFFKKPIVCFTSGLMASGGYYSSLACDKIVVAPGALVGSVGVIMSFANLEKLYDWAKISRYSITSGKFKDSGAEYRSMREDEKRLFQDMIDEVYDQFKSAIVESRPQMKKEVIQEYTDGRVFTGKKAVELGFADVVGTEEEAIEILAGLAKLKRDHYDLFEIPKKKKSLWDLGEEDEEDTINGIFEKGLKGELLEKSLRRVLGVETLNQPLFLMPGVWF
jgi:protease-4